MAVDDARPVQVVRGEPAADPVARQDADAKAPHLAGHVAEHDVIVVQLHPEHGVGQRLDHLALEFNLVLLGHVCVSHPGRLTWRPSLRFTLKLPAPRARGVLAPTRPLPTRAHAGAPPVLPAAGAAPCGLARGAPAPRPGPPGAPRGGGASAFP